MPMGIIGSSAQARETLRALHRESAAYRNLLHARRLDPDAPWTEIPILTKQNFYALHPWRDLMSEPTRAEVISVVRSAGTSRGDAQRGFFWPQSRSFVRESYLRTKAFLNHTLRISERRTLAVVALSMGSWAGGEGMSALFRYLALVEGLPLTVFSPGDRFEEILEAVEREQDAYDQILIMLVPSAIAYLEELIDASALKFPWEKVSFLCVGEAFPESLRTRIEARSRGAHRKGLPLLSIYASADTGVLGVETTETIRLRKAWAASGRGYVPNLFYVSSPDAFLEVVEDRLLVTRNQALPLVRYDLGDHVEIFEGEKNPLLCVYGRAQGCVSLFDSKIFSWVFETVFAKSPWALAFSTGRFIVWPDYEEGRQILRWDIELRSGVHSPSPEVQLALQRELLTLMGECQPEMAADFRRVYEPFLARDPRGLFRFRFVPDPVLTEALEREGRVKSTVVRTQSVLIEADVQSVELKAKVHSV